MNPVVTQITVPLDHPSLAGHFPGQPIVPGVLLLDLIFEAIRAAAPRPLALRSIVSSKFLQAVLPGMCIDVEVTLAPASEHEHWRARFVARHAATPVLEGSFLLATSAAP